MPTATVGKEWCFVVACVPGPCELCGTCTLLMQYLPLGGQGLSGICPAMCRVFTSSSKKCHKTRLENLTRVVR